MSERQAFLAGCSLVCPVGRGNRAEELKWPTGIAAVSEQQQDARYVSDSGRKVRGVLTKCSPGSKRIFLQDELDA